MNLRLNKINASLSVVLTLVFVFYRISAVNSFCASVDCLPTGDFNSIFECCQVAFSEMVTSYLVNVIVPLVLVYLIVSLVIPLKK